MYKMLLAALLVFNFIIGIGISYAESISPFLSYWSPDNGKSNTGIGLKETMPILGPNIELEGRLSYFSDLGNNSTSSLEAIPLEVGLSANLTGGGAFNPFANVGMGYYWLDASRGTVGNEWGMYMGAGLEVMFLQSMAIVGEVVYRNVGDVHHSSSNSNISLDGLVMNLGVSFRF